MHAELSYDDLTPSARNVLTRAMHHAQLRGTPAVEPAHILLGLLDGADNLAVKLLAALQVDRQQLGSAVVSALPPVQPVDATVPSMGDVGQQVVRAAFKEATHLGHYRVDAMHLLLGLLYDNDGLAHKTLSASGVSLYELRQQVLSQPRRFQVRYQDTLRAAVRPSWIFFLLVAIMTGSGAALWFNPSEALAGPLTMLFVLSGWVVSVCIHEFGHALTAHLGGDTAVGPAGYLTLNPLRYSHPLLSVVLPIVFLLMGGLGLPGGAVYIRHGALRSPRWSVLVAAAGPLATLGFALLIGAPFFLDWEAWLTMENYYFWTALAFLAFLQVNAVLFNLIPIPPLDGFQMIAPSLPQAVQQQAMRLSNVGFLLLFLLFRQDSPITDAFWTAVYSVAERLHIPLDMAFDGLAQFMWWQVNS